MCASLCVERGVLADMSLKDVSDRGTPTCLFITLSSTLSFMIPCRFVEIIPPSIYATFLRGYLLQTTGVWMNNKY